MAFRLYFVPVLGSPGFGPNRLRAKYFSSPVSAARGDEVLTTATRAEYMFGIEPWAIVGADLSAAEDAALVAKPDAWGLPPGASAPFDLDVVLSPGEVTAVKSRLEAMNIPADWVDTSDAWRLVVRTVLGIFRFLGRYKTVYFQQTAANPPSLFSGSVTLESTFGSLPQAVRTALQTTASELNISTAGVTGSTKLRVILRTLGANFAGQSYQFNDVAV